MSVGYVLTVVRLTPTPAGLNLTKKEWLGAQQQRTQSSDSSIVVKSGWPVSASKMSYTFCCSQQPCEMASQMARRCLTLNLLTELRIPAVCASIIGTASTALPSAPVMNIAGSVGSSMPTTAATGSVTISAG